MKDENITFDFQPSTFDFFPFIPHPFFSLCNQLSSPPFTLLSRN